MFSNVNDFFSDVWLHFEKCFGKYFGQFRVSRYFGHIIGSRVIFVSLKVLMGVLIVWKF